MKMYGGMKIQIPILTSTLGAGELWTSRSDSFTPKEHPPPSKPLDKSLGKSMSWNGRDYEMNITAGDPASAFRLLTSHFTYWVISDHLNHIIIIIIIIIGLSLIT
jgi:hypothetical protein